MVVASFEGVKNYGIKVEAFVELGCFMGPYCTYLWQMDSAPKDRFHQSYQFEEDERERNFSKSLHSWVTVTASA